MDRVSMFTFQPKVSFSRRVAFRSVALRHLFSLVLSSRFLRSLLRILFCYPFFVNIFLSTRKHLIGKIPSIDFNYSFTTDTKENV